MIGSKIILLLYIIALAYFSPAEPARVLVLLILIYVALNLILYIVNKRRIKQGLLVIVVVYAAVCAVYAHPEFALLLPIGIYEWASFYRQKRAALLLALLPLAFMQLHPLLVQYAFVTVFIFFNYSMISMGISRIIIQEERMEQLRADAQRLAKQLDENQDYLRTSEYMAQLTERNRLSQEIHDGIGHAMTGALIQMEAAKRLLPPGAEQAGALLQNAIGISKEGIEQIRLTLKNTKPLIEQLGYSRLKAMVESFSAKSGIRTSVVHEGNMEIISPLHWKIIHDNVTESLTNAAKYAEATAIHVEVRVLNRFIKAVVADDGQGSRKVVKGLGLLGMEERTAAVNGTVTADGSAGFTVTTLIPYAGSEESHPSQQSAHE